MKAFHIVALAAMILMIVDPIEGWASDDVVTLSVIYDKIIIPEVKYAKVDFLDSCALLENSIRQALINAPEHLSAQAVIPELVVKASVSRQGSRSLLATDCTIKELLDRFAVSWSVKITVVNNRVEITGPPWRE